MRNREEQLLAQREEINKKLEVIFKKKEADEKKFKERRNKILNKALIALWDQDFTKETIIDLIKKTTTSRNKKLFPEIFGINENH